MRQAKFYLSDTNQVQFHIKKSPKFQNVILLSIVALLMVSSVRYKKEGADLDIHTG